MKRRPLVLAILDGWGVAPPSEGNAMTNANLPNFSKFVREYPAMTLHASGNEVGLSFGEMGNSEVGHLNIGAGRVYYQTFPRIEKSILDGTFFSNKAFLAACEHANANKSTLHLMGLVSPGNIHASENHCFALLELAKKQRVSNVVVHVFLDGRDASYNSGKDFVHRLEERMRELRIGVIGSLSGRFYAMDRDNRWERIEAAYRAIAEGVSKESFEDPLQAIEASYAKEVYDEEFVPTVMTHKGVPRGLVRDNDAVIYFNFRPDRARELTKAFVLPSFSKFVRKPIANLFFVTMTEYEKDVPVTVAFPPVVVPHVLAEVLSTAGLTQYHVAETEKYAHVTFFLNGTIEAPFPGEDRAIVPSPQVASYAEAPEMSAFEIGKKVIEGITSEKYDVIIVNFANADMVGHTGNLEAAIRGCEAIDRVLGDIADHVLVKDGTLLITADHGNGEEMVNMQTSAKDKEHSNNPVPFLVISRPLHGHAGPAGDAPEGDLSLVPPVGMLSDVAPTILKFLGIPKPVEMTGQSIL